MDSTVSRPCRVAIVPSETDLGCYRWVISASDGAPVARSPYAFATALGAELSAELWLWEIEASRQAD